eukprot:Pompholyxophrys_sp_v1_NODE_122_length_1766_cov_2.347165.p1 type:complete len:280 gc:universal NODE_122_length_1766_cov_2.347165:840-1(-)
MEKFLDILQTHTTNCPLCGATPSQMNDLENVRKRPINGEYLEYGLSSMHLWIRFLEYAWNVAKKLAWKQGRSNKNIEGLIHQREADLREAIFRATGLIINKPRTGGSGSTNDGNTARRFFTNAETVAQITQLDTDWLKNISTFIRAMSSGYAVAEEKIRLFSSRLAEQCISLYDWHPMPQSVHKALIHGWVSIVNLQFYTVPIGMLSEEAGETTNKEIKWARLHHARKFSREATMQDVFHWRSSDPRIASIIHVQNLKKRADWDGPLPADVLDLLRSEI